MNTEQNKVRKTGIIGGTFDPPHNAHLAIAEAARIQYGLDRVLMMPVHIQPFKQDRRTASAEARNSGFGAGMGLPNMKKYTDSIEVETEIGVGTTVTMVVNM